MYHQNKYITNFKLKRVNLQITTKVVKVPAIKTSTSHHHKITIRNDLCQIKSMNPKSRNRMT